MGLTCYRRSFVSVGSGEFRLVADALQPASV